MNVADGPPRPCSRGQGAAAGRTQQTGDNTARAPPAATVGSGEIKSLKVRLANATFCFPLIRTEETLGLDPVPEVLPACLSQRPCTPAISGPGPCVL